MNKTLFAVAAALCLLFGVTISTSAATKDTTPRATFSGTDNTLTITANGDLSQLTVNGESFVDYLSTACEGYTTVVFKAEDSNNLPTVNNAITRALVKCASIVTLNMEETYLASGLVPHVGGDDTEDASFFPGTPGQWAGFTNNTTLQTLYLPQVPAGSTLGTRQYGYNTSSSIINNLLGLKHLYIGEGIETLGERALNIVGVNQVKLATISFPNSLKYAKKECLYGQTDLQTLTFPAGMLEIEAEAFSGTDPKDVYFLGKEAPKVARFAWGDNNYISNNAMTNVVMDGDTLAGTAVKVDKTLGYAVRANYLTQNGWMAMLHYPADCSKEQAAKYTDITRSYKKIIWGDKQFTATYSADGPGIMSYDYEAGKETEPIMGQGGGNITGNLTATKTFKNIYPSTVNPPYGGNYDGGYDDMYLHEQYQWPSMGMAQRATLVAQNGLLWDGVTTIGKGIQNAAALEGNTSSYTGDGTEYEGLHQFVFAKGDVQTEDTKKWDLSTYADGTWHSICIPVSMTKGQMKEVFGHDEEGNYNIIVCKFNKVTRVAEGKNVHLKLHFDEEKFKTTESDDDIVLQAHVSYMIKAKKENIVEGEEIVLKNYVLEPGNPIPTNVSVTTTDDETPDVKNDGGDCSASDNVYYFIGTYLKGMKMPQYCYFFSKTTKRFRFQRGITAKWNAYTSIVEAPNGASDNELFFASSTETGNSKINTGFGFEEDENASTTGVEKITIIADGEIVSTTGNVYNMNGQLVSTNGTNGLAKGLYIQNGKKILVK